MKLVYCPTCAVTFGVPDAMTEIICPTGHRLTLPEIPTFYATALEMKKRRGRKPRARMRVADAITMHPLARGSTIETRASAPEAPASAPEGAVSGAGKPKRGRPRKAKTAKTVGKTSEKPVRVRVRKVEADATE